MKAPIRKLVEALDAWLHFLPGSEVRQGRENKWLHSEAVRLQVRHYGAWVNFWGISCLGVALLVPVLMFCFVYTIESSLQVSAVSVFRFLLCFPAVMLAVKFSGDAFICLAANAVARFAPGAGCTESPQPWGFRELRESYAWYCGIPRYWVRRINRVLFLLAAMGVCSACYMV